MILKNFPSYVTMNTDFLSGECLPKVGDILPTMERSNAWVELARKVRNGVGGK